MRFLLGALLALHGSIHLLGAAKAFGVRGVPLGVAISKPVGVGWALCALGFVLAALLVIARSEQWALLTAPLLLLSELLVALAFRDAKFGTLVNVALLIPVLVTLFERSPRSFRSIYQREASARLEASYVARPFEEAELTRLPALLRRYLEVTGAVRVGHIGNLRASFRGRIRRSVDAGWLAFEAEQYDFFRTPARLFFLRSHWLGVPFDALHLYLGPSATMQARVAALFGVVDARGAKMNQSETVTLFNDLCLLAPGALVDANVHWQELDARHLRGTFSNAGNSVSAVLAFNEQGELEDFVSDDRFLSADGEIYQSYRWSTPVHGYAEIGGKRLMQSASASWALPTGAFVYAEMTLTDIEYDVPRDLQRGFRL